MYKRGVLLILCIALLLTGCTNQDVSHTLDIEPIEEAMEDTSLETIACIDKDQDGFCSDIDCNDNNPSTYPGAHDICEDRVDSDCDGMDETCPYSKSADQDYDGLSDYDEWLANTDMTDKDTDRDGLNDFDEIITFETDPLNMDTDGDGWADGGERTAGTSPTNIMEYPVDEDKDYLPDAWEEAMFKSGSYRAHEDPDGDSLTALEEFNLNLDPDDSDTDNDRLADDYEIFITHTDPLVKDTDGDGWEDGAEFRERTDPLDENDVPYIKLAKNDKTDRNMGSTRPMATWL